MKTELPGMLKLAINIKKQKWPHTVDASMWVEEWMKAIKKNPMIPSDEGTMVGWFANAIMAGYDTAMFRKTKTWKRSYD